MSKSRRGRDRNRIANRPRLPRTSTKTKPFDLSPSTGRRGFTPPASLRSLRSLQDLTSIGDRRVFHPAPDFHRPVVRLNGVQRHRLVARPTVPAINPVNPKVARARARRDMAGPTNRVAFDRPQEVLLCVRRKSRKEVLHARGVAGRRGIKKYRRNANSSVGC